MLELGDGESSFIIKGIEKNIRIDGRTNNEYRTIYLELDNILNSHGSAQIRINNTEIMVAVKTEIMIPDILHPDEGSIEFYLECSANANPIFQGKGGDELSEEITTLLYKLYDSSAAFDKKKLGICKNEFCWKLYVEILILQYGGNIFDAVSLAVKAALHNTRIPIVEVKKDEDLQKYYIELSNNSSDEFNIDVSNCPLLLTISKIGANHIIDACLEEESCSIASLIFAIIPNGNILLTKKLGNGSLNPTSIKQMIISAKDIGIELHERLTTLLNNNTQNINVDRDKLAK
ncbi:unnamed protein product [Gordionus sp. m RMFG-2023]|uniref:exosome complex exonuclease RRP42-like n=1 Tax=Gordionus sp. m RMFG-2023 TaxID=3053472 RepID=UPI0030DF636F